MAAAFPDGWEELALVSVTIKGGSSRQFAAITETIDISEPDYPGESIMTVAGGRIWKQSAQEDGEITLEIYPIELDVGANDTGLFGQFVGGTQPSGSGALATDIAWPVGIDRTRDRYMVVVTWSQDTGLAAAEAAIDGVDQTALRFFAKEARIISHKTEFTDGIVKTTVTFKFPDMDKAGSAKSWGYQSTDDADTSSISALTYS